MPNVLCLIRKSNGERVESAKLVALDEEICAALGVEPDPIKWCEYWMDTVGLSLAVSNSFARAREIWGDDPPTVRILDYLEENFTSACYYSR